MSFFLTTYCNSSEVIGHALQDASTYQVELTWIILSDISGLVALLNN